MASGYKWGRKKMNTNISKQKREDLLWMLFIRAIHSIWLFAFSCSVTFSRTAICSTILILNFFFLEFANLTSNSSTASVYLFSEIRRSRNPFKLRKMMSFLLGIKKRQCKKHFCLLHCLFAFATPVKLHFIVVFKLLPYVALPFTWKVSFCEVIPGFEIVMQFAP